MKKIVVTLLLLFSFFQTLSATNLAIMNLDELSDDELILMCQIREMECNGSREDILQSLRQQFIEEFGENETQFKEIEDKGIEEIEDSFSFDIKNANTLKLINDSNSIIILEGNVELVFNLEDDEKTINAQKIIIDNEKKKLVGLVNVNYLSNESTIKSFSQEISGDIIYYDFNRDKLLINNGNISTQRKNSEDENVFFNATSSSMAIDSINNSLVLKNGYITTNVKTSYFSISADTISILNHGDMYFKNAKISIGRVPVLYLPFFFSPGAQMLGNPAIGYEYSRGSFVNTTFEIFGKYPNFEDSDSSSFNSLLKNNNTSDKYSEGSIYLKSESDDEIEIWAQESDSFLAFMFDAYEKTPNSIDNNLDKGSIVFSYSYELNLINDTLKLQSNAITSFASDGKTQIDKVNYYPKFRYDLEFKTTLNIKDGKLEFYIPLISDPKVKKTYANRLSTFTIDSLWDSDKTFPSSYDSDIMSYTSYLKANYKYSPKFLKPIISLININEIEAKVDYNWTFENGEYCYAVDDITFPDFDFYINGSFINLSKEINEKSYKDVDNFDKETTDIINKLYPSSLKVENKVINNISNFNMSYTLDNNFSSTYENDDTYDKYNQTLFNLKTSANLAPNIISLNNKLNFKYIYSDDSNQDSEKSIIIKTTNEILLDKINLNYYFDSSLYKWESIEDSSGVVSTKSLFEFSDEFVTKHEFELLDTYSIYDLKITPAIKLVIPPLNWSLKPSFNLSLNDISDKTIFTFDIDSNNFELTDIENNLDFDMNNLSLSFDFFYDIEESYSAINVIDPLKIDTNIIFYDKENNQYFSHNNTYYGLYDGVNNYFSKFNFTYKNSFFQSKLNFYTNDNSLALDYFKNTISFENLERYWWKNRIGLNLDVDLTFNYSKRDIYATYFSLSSSINYRIAEFLLLDFKIKTSNYSFYQYYENDKFIFKNMFSDLLKSFDLFNGGIYNTQFNLENISLDLVHMMEDWDLHCKYEGSVVLSNYNYQWVPSVSIFLQWDALPELKVDQSFSKNGSEWQ